MKALRALQGSHAAIVASGAGLAAFWLIGDLAATSGQGPYLRLALLVFIAVALGLVNETGLASWRRGVVRRDGLIGEPDDRRKAEQELERLIDAIPAQLWSTRADGSAEFLNRRWLEYTGLAQDEAIGHGWLAAVHPDDRDRLVRHRELLVAGSGRGEIEARVRRFDGEYRWFLVRAEPMRDATGQLTHWFGTNTDINDLKQAEQELREAEVRLRTTLDAIPAMVVSSTSDGIVDFINARWVEEGFSEAEVYGGASELVHPDDLKLFMAEREKGLAADEPYDVEVRLRRANGEYRWHLVRSVAAKTGPDGPRHRYATATDIDGRRKAEEALRASERELQLLVDTVPTLLWAYTGGGEPAYINKRLEAYYGLRIDDLPEAEGSRVKGAVRSRVHPDDVASVEAALQHSFETGEPFAMRYRNFRADGVLRWVHGRTEPLRDETGRIVRWYGVITDIDDEVRAQEALRARERELQSLVDTIPALVWCVSANGDPEYINKQMSLYYFGEVRDIDRSEPEAGSKLQRALGRLMHSDDVSNVHETLGHSLRTGEPFSLRYRNRRHDGVYRWVHARAEALRDDDGRIVKWYGVSTDIDDEVRAQEALRARERELQSLVDTIPTFVWSVDPDGRPVYVSKRLLTYYGQTSSHHMADTSLDKAVGLAIHPDDGPAVHRNMMHSLKTGEHFAMRYRNRRADGAYRWVDARAEPLRDEDGRIVKWYGVSVDIDNEIRAQEALRAALDRLSRASQLAGLAELSASIAHEINQPLAAIITNSHACQRWLLAETPNLQRVKTIAERLIRDAQAAADVVVRIRALFKRADAIRTMTDINEVIREVCRLVMDTITAENVVLETELSDSLPVVLADRVQIQQVLVNLIRNSVDAMKSNADVAKLLVVGSRRGEGDTIRVEVHDTGAGIAEPERIFEPFFTTKAEGMGMGLSICRSILEAHGGSLRASNVEPRGAMFAFTLPTQVAEA